MRGVRKNFAVNRIVGESARTQHLDEGDTVSTPKSAPPFASSRDVVAAGPGARYRPGNSSMRQQLEVGVLGDNASTVTDATQLSPLRRPRRRTKRRSQAEAAARATAKKAVKEILLYVIFLVFFAASSILVLQDQSFFWFAAKMDRQFSESEWVEGGAVPKNYPDIETVGQLHRWLQGPFYETLYTDTAYDGSLNMHRPGFIHGVSKIIGGVRIGQLRVKERACNEYSPSFVSELGLQNPSLGFKCYGDSSGGYTSDVESLDTFGKFPTVAKAGLSEFTWNGVGAQDLSIADARSRPLTALRTGYDRSYPFPAFSVVLPNNNATLAKAMLQALQQAEYVDEATRLFSAEVTVYNPMLDMWVLFVFMVETPKAGGMIPSRTFQTVRLYTVMESEELVPFILEIIVAVFFVGFMIAEVNHICKQEKKWDYVTQFSTVAHNANLVAFICVYILRLLAVLYTPEANTVVIDSDTYYNYRTAAAFRNSATHLQALNAFLSVFKLVRFFSYIPRFALVTNTLYLSAAGVTGFGLIFAVVFYGFSAAFMVAFGRNLESYRNLSASGYSLLRSLLGDFNLPELLSAQWLLGILLFALFVALAVFVVLNVLIAIISDAYTKAREEVEKSNDVQLGTEIWGVVKEGLGVACPCLLPWLGKAVATLEQGAHSFATGAALHRMSLGLNKVSDKHMHNSATVVPEGEDTAQPFAESKAAHGGAGELMVHVGDASTPAKPSPLQSSGGLVKLADSASPRPSPGVPGAPLVWGSETGARVGALKAPKASPSRSPAVGAKLVTHNEHDDSVSHISWST